MAEIAVFPEYLGSSVAGKPFSATLNATGGTPPYTFRIVSGSLPLGLELTGNTISGKPPDSIYGVWDFEVEVRDGAGAAGVTLCFVKIFPADIALTVSALPSGSVGTPYSVTMSVVGGVGPRIFKVESGDLPPGLTLPPGTLGPGGIQMSDNNVIKGTPTLKGVFSFVLRISDYFGRSETFSLSISIAGAGEVPLSVRPASVAAGAPGVSYAPVTFSGEGGAGGYVLTLQGNLPKGMTFAGNVLSGTPAADSSGSYPITVQVRDANGAVASRSYTLIITNLAILPAALPSGVAGTPYASTTFTASGGSGGYAFSLKGPLPSGMTFANAVLSGTPSQDSAGTYTLNLEVQDSAGGYAMRSYQLTIEPASTIFPLSLSTPYLTTVAGAKLWFTLRAAGGVAPLTFSLSSGELPPGITLASDGSLEGTASVQGLFRFTVQVQDSRGASVTGVMTIFVGGPLSILSTTLPPLTHNIPYATALTASGGLRPYTWLISEGALPPGLRLDWLNGIIEGLFTSTGSYRFTVQVSDATGAQVSASFTLSFDGTPPSITTDSVLPAAAYQRPYRTKFEAASSNALVWSVKAGSLPDGLALTADGELIGTTGALGTHVFTVCVVDTGRRTDCRDFTISVNPPVSIRTLSPLPDARLGVGNTRFEAAGGVAPYTWSVTGGSLPPGFTLSEGGALGGSTGARGTFSFVVAVVDSAGGRATRPYSIVVEPVLALPPATLPRGLSDTLYSARLAATGGAPPHRWSASGLPLDLALDGESGVISGTPSGGMKVEFVVTVTDRYDASASRPFSIDIDPAPLEVTTRMLPDGAPLEPYSFRLAARGGTKPYAWSLVGEQHPAALRLSPDGALSAVSLALTTYNFTVAVCDASSKCVRAELALRVTPRKLVLTSTRLPDAVAGAPYSVRLAAAGGAPPYGWTVAVGSWRNGLYLAPDGTLAGVVVEPGFYLLSVAVVDAVSNVAAADLELQVLPGRP